MMQYSHKLHVVILLYLLIGAANASSQVKIGGDVKTINLGAILELESMERGVLFPHVALTSNLSHWGLAGGDPIDGMVVFNTNDTDHRLGLYIWYEGRWQYSGEAVDNPNDTLVFNDETDELILNGDTALIPSNSIRKADDENQIEDYLASGDTREGDMMYIPGRGVYIRNEISNATTLGDAFIFIPTLVNQGTILFNNSKGSLGNDLSSFDVAESGLFVPPAEGVEIDVGAPSDGAYYSFAVPNDWNNPIISLKIANGGNGYYELNNCWQVERNVEFDGQLYQVWTLDVPLRKEVMGYPYKFRIQ